MATSDFYEILDPRFRGLFNGNGRVERLASGMMWCEGPAYFVGGRYLVWSDIPNNRMMRYDETDGSVSVFRQPSGNSNGNTVDRQGRLITCEHGGRRVSRTEHDGTIVTLADSFEGKRLNSPNDAVVKTDGSIWFTDPSYGIDSDYEGNKSVGEIGADIDSIPTITPAASKRRPTRPIPTPPARRTLMCLGTHQPGDRSAPPRRHDSARPRRRRPAMPPPGRRRARRTPTPAARGGVASQGRPSRREPSTHPRSWS